MLRIDRSVAQSDKSRIARPLTRRPLTRSSTTLSPEHGGEGRVRGKWQRAKSQQVLLSLCIETLHAAVPAKMEIDGSR